MQTSSFASPSGNRQMNDIAAFLQKICWKKAQTSALYAPFVAQALHDPIGHAHAALSIEWKQF